MINKCMFLLLVTCTAMTCLLGSITSPVHAATLPAGFSESVVLSGLTQPTAVRFSPDGRVFVTEKSGLIKVFPSLTATTLRFFVNNVLRVSTTNASYASGRPGLTIFIGGGGTVGQVQLDNFSANSLTTADTTPPTVPSALTASAVSGTQFNLSWPAATDNTGVTGYQVERCQGVGCTAFALLATPTTTSYGDTGLTPGTTYPNRVRAHDAVGNLSGDSPIATATTSALAAGLVAVYGFTDGTGATSSDESGNNNTATLGTAT